MQETQPVQSPAPATTAPPTTPTVPTEPSIQQAAVPQTPPVNSQPTPSTPPAPEAPKSNLGLILGIILLIILVLAAGGYYAYKTYFAGSYSNQPTPVPATTTTQSPTPVESASPSAQPSASPNANSGTVTGTICYPASVIPAGSIVAKNTVTSKITSFDNAQNTASFSATLTAGTYKFRYEPSGGSGVIGYYTSCTGSEPVCQNNTVKRSSIVVTVTPGKVATGVKLCDYYYTTGMEPDF